LLETHRNERSCYVTYLLQFMFVCLCLAVYVCQYVCLSVCVGLCRAGRT